MTPDNVNADAGKLLADIWKSHQSMPLVINCGNVSALSNYALHALISVAKTSRMPLIFYNALHNVAADIAQELPTEGTAVRFSKKISPCSGQTERVTYLPEGTKESRVKRLIQECKSADALHIKNIIRETFHKNDSGRLEPLHSTPFLASGIYNARHILCEPEQFTWTVLHLEEKLDELVPDWDPARHCLLSGSLRASPFAAALAFAKTPARPVEILDHFGPHPVLLEEHDLGYVRRGLDYIYVGDFIIGGTELKIASNWAARRHCRISKALVLGTLWKDSRYKLGDLKIGKLADLNGLHPKAKYSLEH